MLLGWRARGALKRHRQTCDTCRAATDYDGLCDELRSAAALSSVIRAKRSMTRRLQRLLPRIPDHLQAQYRRDVEEGWQEIAADTERLRAFVRRNR